MGRVRARMVHLVMQQKYPSSKGSFLNYYFIHMILHVQCKFLTFNYLKLCNTLDCIHHNKFHF